MSGSVAVASCSRKAGARAIPIITADLVLHDSPAGPEIPANFTGLSYELAQLTDPTFFSESNRALVAYFRLLSGNGVLRLGGNTSEFCWFNHPGDEDLSSGAPDKANASTAEPKLHVPPGNLDANWMPHRQFAIAPEAIDALAGFLRAAGWRLIYGLNFGNSTPQRAAEEAAYVAEKIGDRLEFFQIGNEPDLYKNASNGTRPPNWDFDDYIKEWSGFAEAVSAKVPGARFGGPDVAASSDWILRFNERVPAGLAKRVVALTGHYYAEGPPNDPRVTIERLLAGNKDIATETREIEAAARARGRIYRMTEGNSCYRGGKPGMSDAFAAALWAGDYMLELASLGCAGVNLHGGGSAYLTAGLGGHTPGMEVAKTPQAVHSGFYSPLQSEAGRPVKAMPVFYGMMLANQFAGCKTMLAECDLKGVNATVYAGRSGREARVAIFNKDEGAGIELAIRGLGNANSGTIWRMQAPRVDSTEGVSLAGAEIGAEAHWTAKAQEVVQAMSGACRVNVPAGSAALLKLE
jgi:hypothetical protein